MKKGKKVTIQRNVWSAKGKRVEFTVQNGSPKFGSRPINISQRASRALHITIPSLFVPQQITILLPLVSFRSWFLAFSLPDLRFFIHLLNFIHCILQFTAFSLLRSDPNFVSLFWNSWDLILYFGASFDLIWLGICLWLNRSHAISSGLRVLNFAPTDLLFLV